MISKVFTIFDSKGGFYHPPFTQVSRGIALRRFTELANQADHEFSKYPGDFTIFEVGEYDDSSGRITYSDAYQNLGTASQFKEINV